jgi:ribonuclease P protein component
MSSIARRITQFSKKEIDSLFSNARRVFRNAACTLLIAEKQGSLGRILIIASRKVGNAPERNLLRRRIKAIFYEEKLYIYPFDGAIILYKKAVGLSFSELKNMICDAYAKEMSKVKIDVTD